MPVRGRLHEQRAPRHRDDDVATNAVAVDVVSCENPAGRPKVREQPDIQRVREIEAGQRRRGWRLARPNLGAGPHIEHRPTEPHGQDGQVIHSVTIQVAHQGSVREGARVLGDFPDRRITIRQKGRGQILGYHNTGHDYRVVVRPRFLFGIHPHEFAGVVLREIRRPDQADCPEWIQTLEQRALHGAELMSFELPKPVGFEPGRWTSLPRDASEIAADPLRVDVGGVFRIAISIDIAKRNQHRLVARYLDAIQEVGLVRLVDRHRRSGQVERQAVRKRTRMRGAAGRIVDLQQVVLGGRGLPAEILRHRENPTARVAHNAAVGIDTDLGCKDPQRHRLVPDHGHRTGIESQAAGAAERRRGKRCAHQIPVLGVAIVKARLQREQPLLVGP